MSFSLKIERGDLVIKNGKLVTITDSEKLIQEILKMCLTPAQSNLMHPWYGSFISRTLIGSALDTDMLVSIGQNHLVNALNNLKSLQEAQVKSLQKVSADEQISSILGVNITRSEIDPSLFNVLIKVLSKGFKPITTNFRITTI